MCVLFITQLLGLVGNRFNHTSWVDVVTPTDHPKSVRNCCVIEVLVAVLCCHVGVFLFFCGSRGFCQRTESDVFLFLFMNYPRSITNLRVNPN